MIELFLLMFRSSIDKIANIPLETKRPSQHLQLSPVQVRLTAAALPKYLIHNKSTLYVDTPRLRQKHQFKVTFGTSKCSSQKWLSHQPLLVPLHYEHFSEPHNTILFSVPKFTKPNTIPSAKTSPTSSQNTISLTSDRVLCSPILGQECEHGHKTLYKQ